MLFWKRFRVFLCVSSLASEFAFLYLSVVLFAFDVVDLEGVVLFGVVSLFVSVSSTFSKSSAGSGIS
jgi:hypothetical protein